MAHTDPEDIKSIIQQKPPPPPRREGDDRPREPSSPEIHEQPAPVVPPLEAPAQQAGAARVAEAHGPASRRPRRPPSGHVIIPARESDPEIISRAGTRPRMDSAPALLLIDYPRASIARATSPSSIGTATR